MRYYVDEAANVNDDFRPSRNGDDRMKSDNA